MITTMDQMPPTVTVTSLAATPAGGIVQVDSTITIAVTFSCDVIVTGGTPALRLNDGGAAVFSGGSGTNTLTFTYKVAVNDRSLPALAVTGLTNGAAIVDAKSKKPANALLSSKTFAGLGIDTLTPVITQIRSLRSQFYF
jgi:large repetitive protein